MIFTSFSNLFIVKPSKTIVFYQLFQFFLRKTFKNNVFYKLFQFFKDFSNYVCKLCFGKDLHGVAIVSEILKKLE